MSEMLEKARKYEDEQGKQIKAEDRPAFHVSPYVGWMNDPNGFSYYQGEYHLFYQYNPYDTHWNSMHWGHVVSKDLLHWKYLPAALAPDEDYDKIGCFSGSAIELEDGRQLLLYTAVNQETMEDGTVRDIQTQAVAVGDGKDYKKYEKNPVLTAKDLPEGASKVDFRDPKIWKGKDGNFYCVIGSRPADGSGQILLYRSENGFDWKFVSILAENKKRFGKMWECPDFYPLDGKQVLMISPQEMEAEGLEFHNGNNTAFLIGNYDKEKLKFTREKVQCVDYGLDFYAPQTMGTEDGRRILIGWMQSWDNPMYPDTQRYSGMMTIPRELSMKDGRICQMPVRELENYRSNVISYDNVCIHEETELKGISGRSIDLQIALKGNEYGKFRIKLAADEKHYSEIIYDRDEKTLTFDRTHSGFKKDTISTRSMYVSDKKDVINLRILVDRFSVEIFVNDGEQVMTSLIYTPVDASGICFASNGKTYLDVTKYDIEVK